MGFMRVNLTPFEPIFRRFDGFSHGGWYFSPSLFLCHTGQILAYCLIFELFCLF